MVGPGKATTLACGGLENRSQDRRFRDRRSGQGPTPESVIAVSLVFGTASRTGPAVGSRSPIALRGRRDGAVERALARILATYDLDGCPEQYREIEPDTPMVDVPKIILDAPLYR